MNTFKNFFLQDYLFYITNIRYPHKKKNSSKITVKKILIIIITNIVQLIQLLYYCYYYYYYIILYFVSISNDLNFPHNYFCIVVHKT